MRTFGYNDEQIVTNKAAPWNAGRIITLVLALLFITGAWFFLNEKLYNGDDWISATYDNEDWRTNEGNLHTFGAWDIEAHIWKTEYIIEHFPNHNWNPYWYLGMPLIKYYQNAFYLSDWAVMTIFGVSAARGAILLVIFGHLLATILTFLLCFKVSKRIWLSALCSIFVLSNNFITLRSYGWEPITVVFLFLYPLGLLVYLREPLRPYRLSVIAVLTLSYLSHPLIWFSLCMFIGLYLLSIAVRRNKERTNTRYMWAYIFLVFTSLALGAVQFFPQISYHQVTSGAHMGVSYLPYYQVPPNIITLQDFFFDAGNLKGPGPIILISFLFLAIFTFTERHMKKVKHRITQHELITGVAFVLFVMILFYYLELYNLFPMNFLRSVQYHRIIPEFIITAALLIAAMSNVLHTYKHKVIYYTVLIAFVLASGIIIFAVQLRWETTSSISDTQEFIPHDFQGRITMPYSDQSLAVRSSFQEIPQVYGYYEQGITNSYNDELFSVSSGYHNAELTILYLQAANVERLYVNTQEGRRDEIVTKRLTNALPYTHEPDTRYAYFTVPLVDPSFAQAVNATAVEEVLELEMGCRTLFQVYYCGSEREEFVSTDPDEVAYLRAYVNLLETPYEPQATIETSNPDHYIIDVEQATKNTAVIVKMTYDDDFVATANGKKLPIKKVGPDFMLISPEMEGDYTILLQYNLSKEIKAGGIVSLFTALGVIVYFVVRKKREKKKYFNKGDMK